MQIKPYLIVAFMVVVTTGCNQKSNPTFTPHVSAPISRSFAPVGPAKVLVNELPRVPGEAPPSAPSGHLVCAEFTEPVYRNVPQARSTEVIQLAQMRNNPIGKEEIWQILPAEQQIVPCDNPRGDGPCFTVETIPERRVFMGYKDVPVASRAAPIPPIVLTPPQTMTREIAVPARPVWRIYRLVTPDC